MVGVGFGVEDGVDVGDCVVDDAVVDVEDGVVVGMVVEVVEVDDDDNGATGIVGFKGSAMKLSYIIL